MNEHNIHGGNLLARRKQVNTLHIFNENVIEVRHDLEYRITFQVNDHVSLSLQILLPPEFPNRSRPLLRIIPAKTDLTDGRLSHPWLGTDNLVVGSPGLNNFGIHSDLGRVVQAIKREFEKNPPAVIKKNNSNQIQDNLKHEPSSSTFVLKSVGSQPVIPEIEKLSKEELKELQTDQLAFKVFSRQLNVSMLSSMDESTEKLKEEILSSIETNDKLTHELVEKKEIFQLKLSELESAKKNTSEKKRGLVESAEQLAQPVLCDNLLAASHTDECESEKCADQFLSGNLSIDDFLTQYIQTRTQHHVRKTKHDRIMAVHKRDHDNKF